MKLSDNHGRGAQFFKAVTAQTSQVFSTTEDNQSAVTVPRGLPFVLSINIFTETA